MKKIKITLAWKILIALILGILFGTFLLQQEELKNWIVPNLLSPAGEIFIRMIRMIVVPIVISTLIVGISGIGGAKKLGSVGFKTILYFEIVTTLAIILGITLSNFFHPGNGIDMSIIEKTKNLQHSIEENINFNHKNSLLDVILSVIPSNIFYSMAKGDMLPIIFFSVFFGLGLSSLPKENKKPLLEIFNIITKIMFKITQIIMNYAPIGVFSLITSTISTFGFSSLLPLAKLVLLVYGAILFFALIVLGAIARIYKFRIWKLINILKEELILSFSTASSESVLPKIIEKMEAYGASHSITSFVIPMGYSFNLDGSTLYQSIAAIFIAQLYNIELSLSQEVILVLTLMVTSKGIAGVPGVSFVVLLATLGSVGIPLEGLTFIAGVDRILDMARTALNVIGNALAVLVISKWEGKYNYVQASIYENKVFSGKNL